MLGLGSIRRLRSCKRPYVLTKPCDPPEVIDDRKSPLFSTSDFLSLFSPHYPVLLPPDDRFHFTDFSKIIPIININPLSVHSELQHAYGFKFEQTFTNSIYALLTRVLAVPSVPIPKYINIPTTWLEQIQRLSYFPEAAELDYLNNLKPHQKHRILQAYAELDFSKIAPKSLEVFPKCDELLFKAKPRIIWNVPAFYQAFLGPVIRALTLHMKRVFDGLRIYTSLKGLRFTLMFACGVVSKDLDSWFNRSCQLLRAGLIDWAGIFLGDDTAILYLQDGKICSRESDFSAFDSTQRSAVQKRIISLYKIVGVPEVFLPYFWSMASSRLVVRYGPDRKFKFKITLSEPQTATGKPDTCVANTLINMDSTIHMMDGGLYSDYGFDAKIKIHSHLADVTFLKGFWCLDITGHYVWNYLPSLSLKLLKTFTFGSTDTLKKKLCENLSSIGPCSTPIISTLIKRFIPEFKQASTVYKIFSTDWRELHPVKINKFLMRRYGGECLPLFHSLISQLEVVVLGSDLYHPLWRLLASVDYGDGLKLEQLI